MDKIEPVKEPLKVSKELERVRDLIGEETRVLSAQHFARMTKREKKELQQEVERRGESFEKYTEEIKRRQPPIVHKKPLKWRIR